MRTLNDYIRWCNRAQRTLATLAVLLVMTFYVFAYRPRMAALEQLKRETIAMQADARTNRSKSDINREVTEQNLRLKQTLERIKKPASPQELPDLIKGLNKSAQDASLKTFTIKPGSFKRGDLLVELPYVLTMDGDFMNVFAFLQSTEQMKLLTRVRSISMKSKDVLTGQVSATVSLNTYFSVE